MLLALWFDFPPPWPTGPTPPPPVVTANPGAGGGREEEYRRADSEYWDARAEMLSRRHVIPVPKEAPAEVREVIAQQNTIVRAIERQKTPNMALLRETDKKLADLALQLEILELESDEDAVLVLLLS